MHAAARCLRPVARSRHRRPDRHHHPPPDPSRPGPAVQADAAPASPVPPGTPRTHLATRPVPSTGPYQVAQFIPGRRLLLVRNTRFREWSRAAQPDGYPDRIDIRMDDNPSHRVQAVLRGQADLALEIASANLAPLRTRFASQLRLDTQPDTSFLTFNIQRPPFSNVLARRAVNLAIDRAAAARRLGGPGLSIPTCQVLPPHFPGYKDYCPWTRGPHDGRWHGPDIARARALVRASGTAGATVDFISPSNDPIAAAATGALVSALREIGYRPRVISGDADFHRRLGNPHGRWDISDGDWIADYPSPGEFLGYFLSCANYHPNDPARTTNGGGFCNASSTASSGKPRHSSSPTPRPLRTSGPAPTTSPSTKPPGCRWRTPALPNCSPAGPVTSHSTPAATRRSTSCGCGKQDPRPGSQVRWRGDGTQIR